MEVPFLLAQMSFPVSFTYSCSLFKVQFRYQPPPGMLGAPLLWSHCTTWFSLSSPLSSWNSRALIGQPQFLKGEHCLVYLKLSTTWIRLIFNNWQESLFSRFGHLPSHQSLFRKSRAGHCFRASPSGLETVQSDGMTHAKSWDRKSPQDTDFKEGPCF
jgi:hypothetical protein